MSACSLSLQPVPNVVQARFDPSAHVLPMPTDVVRDAKLSRLNLPLDDDLSAGERELRVWLNQLDGWPTTLSATVSFSGRVDGSSIDENSVQVWRWGQSPIPVAALKRELDSIGTGLTIAPPELGWERGQTYVIVVRGGTAGVRGAAREPVIADAAFYFLRSKQHLDDPAHQRAFPGDTLAERLDNGKKLEEIRLGLAPYFDKFEKGNIPREEIAILWSFTATSRTEIAMDKVSQRMPLPFDLLLDRTTHHIDIPAHDGDSPVESEGKKRLADFDGWALSGNPMFETSAPIETPASDAVELYEVGGADVPPRRISTALKLYSDRMHVEVTPAELLKEATTYGLVIRDSLRAENGLPVVPMTIGQLMRSSAPIEIDGKSQIGGVSDEDAARVEWTRQRISKLLDMIGRDHVVSAWPFTTQTVVPLAKQAIAAAAEAAPAAKPENIVKLTPIQALTDFPLAISSLLFVNQVYHGTLKLPTWLDDDTRAWRRDSKPTVRTVAFTLTLPRGARENVPVVIFGHAIATERRFVLSLGDALAQRGFAAISIDFPYHGADTRCIDGGLIAVPDPQTGKLQTLPPCQNGYTCKAHGRCVDAFDTGNHLSRWPVLNFPVASGAAFIEIDHIGNTRDHFLQAVLDLSELHRSLREADWSATGVHFDSHAVHYAGQSLGGIIGGSFASLDANLNRVVLNVPGCDLVDMFSNSSYFGSHIQAFFTREKIDSRSWQAARFLNLARLMIDNIDPQSMAYLMKGRPAMIQMATLDLIIPNPYTELLSRLSGMPKRDYVAEHAFVVIPIEPAFARGQADLADFLVGKLVP